MSIKQAVLLIFIFFCPYFVVPAYGVELKELYFFDNFSGDLTQKWDVFNNGGLVSTGSSGLTLSSNSRNYPFLSSKNNIFPATENYEIDIKYSFPTTTDFGVGFGFGNYIPPYAQLNYPTPSDFINWIYFYGWQGKNDNHLVLGRNCLNNSTCNPNLSAILNTAYNSNEHTLSFKFSNDHFEISHNGVDIQNPILLNSSRRPTNFWLGNPVMLQTANVWTSLNIKEISVYKLVEPATEKEVQIVLPGFGGSWDVGAVLRGTEGTNWKIPPFVKEYDGIINSLKNAGYEEDKDLFIFPYDWRKNLNSLATDLNTFIVSKNLGDRKINLVGHSMGGLVARTYLQNFNNPNVNNLVMAGSPNKGIIDAYNLWEGATVYDAVWWQKVLLSIASEVNRQPGETKINAVRRIAPSVKDLMPTENFLLQNSVYKPWVSLVWKNDFLNQINQNIGTFLPKIVSGGSKDYSTRAAINIESANTEDKIMGLWTDGKPKTNNPFVMALGDGFVTEKSSKELFTNKLDLSGGHGETISKLENIKNILAVLNIATESAVSGSFDTRKKAFVAKLNSPGKLHVCAGTVCDTNLGLVFEDEKMIIVPGYNDEKYSVSVASQGETGNYELLLGEIEDKDHWKSAIGKLTTPTQTDNYFYDGVTEQITVDDKTVDSNMKIYWSKKLRLSDVYEERQKILESIENNLKKQNISEFDLNLDKWRTLDYYVASQHDKDKSFVFGGWDNGRKRIRESKYFKKTNNYFSESLVSLLNAKEAEYKNTPYWKVKLKVDKLIQVLMLKGFMGGI